MHFATRVRTWRVARLYSEIALSRKPFEIGHMYTYTFLLRMTDTVTSQNTVRSSWDTLYIDHATVNARELEINETAFCTRRHTKNLNVGGAPHLQPLVTSRSWFAGCTT
jgi:hypothetical protein